MIAVSLAVPILWLPGNQSWLRRFQTPEVTKAWTLAQDFTMSEDGLNGLALASLRVGASSGQIRLRLLRVSDAGEDLIVAERAFAAAEIAGGLPLQWAFIPIEDSQFQPFRLEITATDNSGLALIATRGNDYAGGVLTANGTSRWADLVFQTSSSTRPAPLWKRLWSGRSEPGRASGKLILVLLAINWIATGFLFRAVLSILP